MPPFDFWLAVFPAQKYDTAVSQVRKIAETEIDVFDENAQFLNGLQILTDLVQAGDI